MTAKELAENCGFEVINLGNPDAEVSAPYCCDLLSIAMGNAPSGSSWCTVMSNMNTLAVASLTEAGCVVLCCEVNVDENMKMKAVSEHINLFRTDQPIFETALLIYEMTRES